MSALGIDQCHCFNVRRAARQVTRFYDAHLEPTGLHITQFLMLAALKELETAAVNVLAERLDIERTAMGKLAGFLARDGLVTIKPSPSDARTRMIELTDKGKRLHDKAAPLWREAQRQFQQLNGVKKTTALRQGLSELKVDDLALGLSDE
jgi:DNA-binding MarR family transcriptional regulator